MADEVTADKHESPRAKSGMLALIKGVVLVAIIVLIECVAVAMLLPTEEDTQELAKDLVAARVNGTEATRDDDGKSQTMRQEDVREVNLGAHHIAVFQPSTNTTLRIDLRLYGTVLARDLTDFERLYPLHEHRLSEQVHATFRAAEIADLTDAGLGLIKRQILEKSNRTLGKPLLTDVVFSEFSFLEQ